MNAISLKKYIDKYHKKASHNKGYIEMLQIETSNIQQINSFLSIGIPLWVFFLILVFLYKIKKNV